MGVKIKTAWEKAMERFEEKSKQVSSGDILRMECLQEGQKLVGRYLAEPDFDLPAALEKHDSETRELLVKVVGETLLNRLVLPQDKQALQDNQRVMKALPVLKQNKQELSKAAGELEHMFKYYLQSLEQARQSLEQQLSAYIEEVMKQKGMRPGPGTRVNPEMHPKFHEEWSKLLSQINQKFMPAFNRLRQRIKEIE